MVDRFISGDMCGDLRAVLVSIAVEVGDCGVRAGNQHLRNAVERIANLAEELVLCAHSAAMLSGVMCVGRDLVGYHLLGVELQDLRRLVVSPDHSME